MSKVAIIFWTGTGNTQAMANCVADGIKSRGGSVDIFTAVDFSKSMIENYDALAFGCPSMGDEVLEETEFQPMWDDVKDGLSGKKVALFGSYDWGDGEWMRIWEKESSGDIVGTYICREDPDAEAQAACKELGEKLV